MDIATLLTGAAALVALRIVWWLVCELWPERQERAE